jgi:hypothetical protein
LPGTKVGEEVGGGEGLEVGAVVGAVVGQVVGATVGGVVGPAVGTVVGRVVGALEGSSVGPVVGTPEGAATGFSVGRTVGEVDGSVVGATVGSAVGTKVGSALGPVVGGAVVGTGVGKPGVNVGDTVGVVDGLGVGSAVGSADGTPVGSAAGSEDGSPLGSAVGSAVGSRVGSPVGHATGWSVPGCRVGAGDGLATTEPTDIIASDTADKTEKWIVLMRTTLLLNEDEVVLIEPLLLELIVDDNALFCFIEMISMEEAGTLRSKLFMEDVGTLPKLIIDDSPLFCEIEIISIEEVGTLPKLIMDDSPLFCEIEIISREEVGTLPKLIMEDAGTLPKLIMEEVGTLPKLIMDDNPLFCEIEIISMEEVGVLLPKLMPELCWLKKTNELHCKWEPWKPELKNEDLMLPMACIELGAGALNCDMEVSCSDTSDICVEPGANIISSALPIESIRTDIHMQRFIAHNISTRQISLRHMLACRLTRSNIISCYQISNLYSTVQSLPSTLTQEKYIYIELKLNKNAYNFGVAGRDQTEIWFQVAPGGQRPILEECWLRVSYGIYAERGHSNSNKGTAHRENGLLPLKIVACPSTKLSRPKFGVGGNVFFRVYFWGF